MASFLQLFVIAAAIATICGQSVPVTSTCRDYFLITQREFLHEVKTANAEVALVNARYADRLDVIQWQQQQLLSEIAQHNRTLLPLQVLSLVRKQCIQRYNLQLVTFDIAKSQMKLCLDKAAVVATTLTSTAQSLVNTAEHEAVSKYPTNVVNCDRNHAINKNDTALQLCYIKYADASTYSMNYYLATARDHMAKALYDSSVTLKTAVQCSFVVEKDTLESNAKTTKAIEDCETSLNKLDQDLITGNVTDSN